VKSYSDLFNVINAGSLLKFLAERGKSYSKLRHLLERFSFLALDSKVSARQIIKMVKFPVRSNIWMTTLVIKMLIKVTFKGNTEGSK
jgi:hypothetical protein